MKQDMFGICLRYCVKPWIMHFYDTIVGYQCEIDVHAQGTVYKNAIENHDLQLLLLLVV